jgi:hypothetical protein
MLHITNTEHELIVALCELRNHGGAIPLWHGKPAVEVRDIKTTTMRRGAQVEYHTRFYHLTEDARRALAEAHMLPWSA